MILRIFLEMEKPIEILLQDEKEYENLYSHLQNINMYKSSTIHINTVKTQIILLTSDIRFIQLSKMIEKNTKNVIEKMTIIFDKYKCTLSLSQSQKHMCSYLQSLLNKETNNFLCLVTKSDFICMNVNFVKGIIISENLIDK